MKRAEDQIIGRNIRRFRTRLGMSQTAVGEKLGITFQQVQKYEKGANRVGGSRVVQLANILGVTITDLFEGTATTQGQGVNSELDPCLALGTTQLGLRLARAFGRLPPKVQRAMVELAEGMTENKAD